MEDYSSIILILADLIKVAFPCSFIFAMTAKLSNFFLDFVFNRKIQL